MRWRNIERQETRQWCFVCGKHRLRGIVERHPSGAVALRVRCPQCSPRYQIDFTNISDARGLGPIRSFRPAIKRVMHAGAEFYHACLNQQRCPTCQSTVQIQIIDRSSLVPPYTLYDALPLGIYARVECPNCGISFCEKATTILALPISFSGPLRLWTRFLLLSPPAGASRLAANPLLCYCRTNIISQGSRERGECG